MRNVEQAMSHDRLGFTFEDQRPDRFNASKTLRQEAGRFAQQDRSGVGCLLKSGCDIGSVTDHRVIHREPVTNGAKDDRPAVNTDAHA